ncbi:MAG TPA: N-acetylglucosamine-6-phosphate deacetylase [Caldilineaceae bacterium]|nr:N-acetylglucosamine-6-phosphate deacetylase [Caldilineaceae bacterium]
MGDSVALTNGTIVLPDRLVNDQALVVADGVIVDLVEIAQIPPTAKQIDVGGRLIAPGLVDIHIHGARGHTFNEPTAEAFTRITQTTAANGITSLLATTATDDIENLVSCLDFTAKWMQEARSGSTILGAHVEGPYFNVRQAGAQDPAHIRNPDDGTPALLLTHHSIIRILTFAPELPGAKALTEQLKALGIVAAAGHSNAKEEEVLPLIDRGLSHMIHMWSAQSTTVREGPWRKPGLLEVSLTDERLTGEIIADGKHLPPTLMKLAYKCLGAERLCAVSDATSGAGLPDGSRFRMGGLEYEVHDGVGMLFDRTAFAGSTTLLNQMLPILINDVGIPLVAAVRMASLTPAQVIGMAKRKGSLEVGKDADIAIFNADFTTWQVYIAGQRVLSTEPVS